MGVSENSGTPKSSILIGFSIINHPFWGYPYFWKYPYGNGMGPAYHTAGPEIGSAKEMKATGRDLMKSTYDLGQVPLSQ